MWIYQKKLEYPVNITTPNPRMAKALMAQYGGPDSDVCAHKGLNQNSPVFGRFAAKFQAYTVLFSLLLQRLLYALPQSYRQSSAPVHPAFLPNPSLYC